jgi:hypothetical protein
MPGTLAVDGVLVHTPEVGVFADGFRVYPYGFTFKVTALAKDAEGDDVLGDPFGLSVRRRARTPADRDNALRIGIEFPDGRGATVDGPRGSGSPSEPPEPPVLRGGGGSGGGGRWEQGLWVWNLPAEGDVSIVYSWLAREVPESRLTLDGEALRAAAARAVVLWPEPVIEEDGGAE